MHRRSTQTNEPGRGRRIEPAEPDAPVLSCRPLGSVPVPSAVPEVAWRDGAWLLVKDGRTVLARSDPHGAWLDWIDHPFAHATPGQRDFCMSVPTTPQWR